MIDTIENLEKEHEKLFDEFHADAKDDDYFRKYLKIRALKDQKNGIAQTFLFIRKDENGKKELLGFYSVRASSLIRLGDEFQSIGEPAVEILELAVKKTVQKQGIGTKLIKDAVANIYNVSKSVGVKYILVCSKEDSVGFYKKFNFDIISTSRDIPREENNTTCIPLFAVLGK